MLFLKTTSAMKAPGIYDVDVAAKPPGKTFGVFFATDQDNPPVEIFTALENLGFKNTHISRYTHKEGKKIVDFHYHKPGTDIFEGWKNDECETNLRAIADLLGSIGIKVAPRVMSLAEAYR